MATNIRTGLPYLEPSGPLDTDDKTLREFRAHVRRLFDAGYGTGHLLQELFRVENEFKQELFATRCASAKKS